MKQKNKKIIFFISLFFALLIPIFTVFAAANISSITKDQTVPRDWFAFEQNVSNQGTIKGDMITMAQYTTASGKIEGDLLSASFDITSEGIVYGDARLVGTNIKIFGDIGKNVNIFSNMVRVGKTTKIGGNLITYANDIDIAGIVSGYSRINGNKIVLSGEFYGDVDINVENEYSNSNVLLHILPDAKIYGKLTYKGINEALIEDGSEINNYEWIKALDKRTEDYSKSILYKVKNYYKILVSAIIYFFIAMLIYRLFPGLFQYQGTLIKQKPLIVVSVGLVAIALILAAVVTFIFLIAVTVLIAKPGIAFIFAAVMGLIYIILFYFSVIPASMYIGNVILNNRYNVPIRFGIGFILITFILSMLDLMGGIHGIGIIFSALKVILSFGISVAGIGAMLYSFGSAYNKLRNYEN